MLQSVGLQRVTDQHNLVTEQHVGILSNILAGT